MLPTDISWVSESFRQDIGQFHFPRITPCKSANYFISRFQHGEVFDIKNTLIMKTLTDFRKMVETGVDPRLHGLSKSRAIPFSQVSADSFRFNIQKCSRSLYAFIALRPTCFARRLVMRNLHEISTQRAR